MASYSVAIYRISIKPSAVKELEALPKKDRLRVAMKIETLAAEPRPVGCEKLSGQEQYRFRQGRYRIVYSISDREKAVDVFKIAHRREAYR